MDFSSLKQNITPFWKKVKIYSGKASEKAKVYGDKALDFTQRQAQATPIFLKTEEAYTLHISSKRSILIAYDENEIIAQEVLLRSPVWAAKAWMDNAEIRYISLTKSPDLARTIGVIGPIEMRVLYEGYEYLRTNEIGTMKQWWESRIYQKDHTLEDAPETSDKISIKSVPHPLTKRNVGKKSKITKEDDPLADT